MQVKQNKQISHITIYDYFFLFSSSENKKKIMYLCII